MTGAGAPAAAPSAPARKVHDGDLLSARLWLPDAPTDRLYVTFGSWRSDPGRFAGRGPVRRALARGFAHLHVESRWNDWFLNAETAALETALAALAPAFPDARALGFSMGGYGALRFAAALGLRRALLVSPQVSLDPRVVPGEDRYPEAAGFDPEAGSLVGRVPPTLAGVIAFDPFHRLDIAHADRISALAPGLVHARLPFGGHPASAALGQAGGFAALQKLSLRPRPLAADVLRLHRAHRGRAARYWAERAAACLRSGRTDAASCALDRAEALALPASDPAKAFPAAPPDLTA